MYPKEQEIREFAAATPFVPFTLVAASGERYKVPTHDHIFFASAKLAGNHHPDAPNVDDDGASLPDEERSQMFTVFARGSRVRHLFFDLITAIETEATPGARAPAK
jgi:hypothetical protein